MQYQRESTNDREILRRVRQLSPQQVVEVVDFIDFLITRQPERHPLLQLMSETPGPEVELRELRQRLTAIPGNMSDTVREIRNERG